MIRTGGGYKEGIRDGREVWIDGEKVGETPMGNLPVTIGTHEILFRHPDLGERRRVTTVTLTAPARVSVDMGKP